MPTRFLLGITEKPAEFRIDLQNAFVCVEQNDGFRHPRKQPVEEGRLSIEHVQRNDRAITSLSHGGNCSAICEENDSFQISAHNFRLCRMPVKRNVLALMS